MHIIASNGIKFHNECSRHDIILGDTFKPKLVNVKTNIRISMITMKAIEIWVSPHHGGIHKRFIKVIWIYLTTCIMVRITQTNLPNSPPSLPSFHCKGKPSRIVFHFSTSDTLVHIRPCGTILEFQLSCPKSLPP